MKLLLVLVLHAGATTWHVCLAAAMNQLTKNLCCEWGPDGIRVNAVSPWYTLTPLAQQVLQDKEYEAKVLSRTPLKRVAQPDEVSGEQIVQLPGVSPCASVMSASDKFLLEHLEQPLIDCHCLL